mgnify:CR=1 FL=1
MYKRQDYTVLQNPAPNVTSVSGKTGVVTLNSSDVGLTNVENTALSTWNGSNNITTLGVVTTGTWDATTLAVNKGGTGQTSYTNGQLLIGNTTGNTLSKATLTAGSNISITNGTGSITIASTHSNATTSEDGLMASGDKAKLNAIDASADVTDATTVAAAGALMVSEQTDYPGIKNVIISDLQPKLNEGVFVDGDKIKLDGLIDWTASNAGTIDTTNIPAIAITSTQTVSNQTTHLALTAQQGDIVIRTDESKTYVHNGGSAGTMSDYTLLATPSSITDLDITGDNSGSTTISLVNQNLKLSGTSGGITTTITDQEVTFSLDNTAVTANSYGSSTAIPVITVDPELTVPLVVTSISNTSLVSL